MDSLEDFYGVDRISPQSVHSVLNPNHQEVCGHRKPQSILKCARRNPYHLDNHYAYTRTGLMEWDNEASIRFRRVGVS